MTRYGITGPTELTTEQERIVADTVLLTLRGDDEATEFTSGAAFGVDTLGAFVAERVLGAALIRLTIPAGKWHNGKLVRYGQNRGWEVEYVEGGYMKRNDATIAHTDVLIACPPTSVEVMRGKGAGTWATIRRGLKAGCEVRITPVDDSEPWVEPGSLRLDLTKPEE